MVIKQIVDAPESGLKLYGMTFGMVTIVGIVRSVDHSSTKITVTLEDFTGQIDAHLWLDEGDISNTPNLLLNTYARVHGAIRNQGGTKALMIFKIEQLSSVNEFTTHLLEVLNARYMAEDYSKSSNDPNSNAVYGNVGANNYTTNTGFNEGVSNGESSGLKGKHLLIFNAVKEHRSEQGISLQQLQQKFNTISQDELQ